MCGIVGYVGTQQASPILLNGLEKLEYRGYDSAGIAIADKGHIEVAKAKGRLSVLKELLKEEKPLYGTIGIGHTRWATHGEPSQCNSHPHVSNSGKFAVVHNGIIENYAKLKDFLISKGKVFLSETDTEVIVQLLEYCYHGDLLAAVIQMMGRLEGSYALGILCTDYPDELVAIRKDSPLIVGTGKGENFIASDVPAILSYTREVYRLGEKEIAVISKEEVKFYNTDKELIEKELSHIDWDVASAEKSGFEHFMMKEIMEQPKALRDTISPRIRQGRVVLDDISLGAKELKNFHKICIVACGSAYHVGVVAKYEIEQMTGMSVEVDVASEFRYRSPIINQSTLVIIISQSGETADTLAALKEAKRQGARTLSIVNVVGSSIAAASDDVIYTWAGPEIAVATTKAYSTQLAVIYLISLYIAEQLGTMGEEEYRNAVEELLLLPDKVESVLKNKEKIQYLASIYYNSKDVFFIGRNLDYALGLEGSLKLKEISYIHSEAYAAGELKHGTISLIEEGTLVIALASYAPLFEKTMSNVKEVKARGAVILGITMEGEKRMEEECDNVLYLPAGSKWFLPSLCVIPLQLFAYYVASERGCDIDKPRNLAKSVTVE